MGLVKKSPVLGSALRPTIRLLLLLLPLSKRIGSAGRPYGGGGENRSSRRSGADGGARIVLDTSMKSFEAFANRRGITRVDPSAITSSSLSELSLLISTTSAAARVCVCVL